MEYGKGMMKMGCTEMSRMISWYREMCNNTDKVWDSKDII